MATLDYPDMPLRWLQVARCEQCRRHRLSTVGLLVALLLLAACGAPSTPATTHQATELRVALSPTGGALPAHVAATRGIFERNGLRVTITEGNDLPGFTAAMDQGLYDIVLSVPTIVLVAADHGIDVQVVSRLSKSTSANPSSMWITKDPAITSVGQLRGARIGVPALNGQLTDALVYLLERAGVARDQVSFVQTPFATMLDQLEAGRLDAAVTGAPFSTAMAARGFRLHDDVVVAAVHEASGGRVDDGMTALFACSARFTREHPEAVRAWRASLEEAVAQLSGDENAIRDLYRTWLKMPPEVAAASPLPTWELEITPSDLQPYVTISKSVGSIDREPDVTGLVWQDHP
ncbi:ABC transporter substrate-binding protein [Pseudonocardia lutea]|jgi:ABC-type nitrate/sulfonate/bicarbonate transport system substrate-binding protein|uniref:ABC transporter substrate-binding protein n=2 Tax=Pseudonocardia lutea TaxID=2172015 RepID=A0ABW1IA00_9PSEU